MERTKEINIDLSIPHFGLLASMLNTDSINVETVGLESIMAIEVVNKYKYFKFVMQPFKMINNILQLNNHIHRNTAHCTLFEWFF